MSQRLEITADIVASVVRPLVEPGVPVDRGQALLLVESMKMEIPVVAPEAGVVASLDVTAGDVIEEGDVLAVIETAASSSSGSGGGAPGPEGDGPGPGQPGPGQPGPGQPGPGQPGQEA